MSLTDIAKAKIRWVNDTRTALEFIEWGETLQHQQRKFAPLSIDTETTGLIESNWLRENGAYPDFVKLVSVSDEWTAWAIPTQQFKHTILEFFNLVVGVGTHPIVFHNAPFDTQALALAGLWDFSEYPEIHDTMIAHSVLWSHLPHDLENMSNRAWPDLRPKAQLRRQLQQKKRGKQVDWENQDVYSEEYLGYAAVDALITQYLHLYMQERLREDDMVGIYDNEMRYQRIMEKAMWKGFRVDIELAQSRAAQYRADAAAIKKELGWNPGSARDIIREIPDLPREMKTPKGQQATSRAALEQSRHPSAAKIIEYKKKIKYASAYFDSLSNTDPHGLVHPSFRSMGARTGRSSMANPPIHQLPKDVQDVRECIIPRATGNVFVSIDYSQQEARLFCHFSGSQEHLDAINKGVDLHQFVADRVGMTRTQAKTYNFALIYGAGIDKIAYMLGLSANEAQQKLDDYYEVFPAVEAFMTTTIKGMRKLYQVSNKTPFVTTTMGRRIWVDSDKPHVAVNYICQGEGADVLKAAVLRIDDMGLADYIVVPVHDELLLEIPEAKVTELVPVFLSLMEVTDGTYEVPLICDASKALERWRKD